MKGEGLHQLQATFARLKAAGRKALVTYLMAGDPDPEFTARLVPSWPRPARTWWSWASRSPIR
ncbi:MAG TPA: hypothetical protein VKB51_15285 [bacterium]|nr:hypothetical protein [bacterium]